jgi:hypothetical protein
MPLRPRPPHLFLLLGLLALPWLGAAESLFFSSDEASFQGEALPSGSAKGYVLELVKEGSKETRILRLDGRERERLLIEATRTGRRETHSIEGRIDKILEYDARSYLLAEKSYVPDSDSPILTLLYSYAQGRLKEVKALDGEGLPTGSLVYRYDPKGRLLELGASGSFGAGETGMVPGLLPPALLWSSTKTGDGSLYSVVFYDAEGRPVRYETRQGQKSLSTQVLQYGKGGLVLSRQETDGPAQAATETSYDQLGRAVLKVTKKAGIETGRESFSYDDKGRLVEDLSRQGKTVTRRTWTYDEGDVLSRESTTIDGSLFSVVSIKADGSTVKELYDKGVLFLRSYHSKGKLLREEFMSNGLVVRTKDYP